MEITHNIQPNQTHTQNFTVESDHSADHIGSGAMQVLATPMMIAYMESVSLNLLQQTLPAGFSSVGSRVDVRHLAPTKMGSVVKVQATVLEIEGNKITLQVQAWDGETLIGSGTHIRYLIDVEKFMQKLN